MTQNKSDVSAFQESNPADENFWKETQEHLRSFLQWKFESDLTYEDCEDLASKAMENLLRYGKEMQSMAYRRATAINLALAFIEKRERLPQVSLEALLEDNEDSPYRMDVAAYANVCCQRAIDEEFQRNVKDRLDEVYMALPNERKFYSDYSTSIEENDAKDTHEAYAASTSKSKSAVSQRFFRNRAALKERGLAFA